MKKKKKKMDIDIHKYILINSRTIFRRMLQSESFKAHERNPHSVSRRAINGNFFVFGNSEIYFVHMELIKVNFYVEFLELPAS